MLYKGPSLACERTPSFQGCHLFFPSPLLFSCPLRCTMCPTSTGALSSSASVAVTHLLIRKPPIHLNLQANQRRSGQKYSKWNCWNSGVLRMSRRKAMSRSDSVSMMRSSKRANSSPMVTRNKRKTLRMNLFTSSTSLGGGLVLTIRSALLPALKSAACPSIDVPASDPFSSSMLQGAPLRWRAPGISIPCSATGVGSMLSEGL